MRKEEDRRWDFIFSLGKDWQETVGKRGKGVLRLAIYAKVKFVYLTISW